MPETSIVIRTLNEEKHLGNLLKALTTQTYRDFEVIVVDSGSTDHTLEIARTHNVTLVQIDSRDFTFGYSLNVGCEKSRGSFLVFVSAHVLPTDREWLGNLIAPFRDEKVAMVYGRQRGYTTSKFSECMDFRRLFGNSPVNAHAPLHYANNANSAVRRSLWEKRPFDEYLFGLEDIDWARHYAKEGCTIHYEPTAGIYHIHEERWSQVFNRYRREAIAAVRIGMKQPPQVHLSTLRFGINLVRDFTLSFPNYTPARIEEIFRFRYYQWKGSRIGWKQGNSLTLETDRQRMFFPAENHMVVIKDVHQAELEDSSLPLMRPSDVLIRVDYVGVCRTDIEVYEGSLGYYRDGHAHYPIVPGHEFSGTIVKVGSNNKYQERYHAGDRVVGECILSRGEAKDRKEVGVINHNGAYSKFVLSPGHSLHKVPDTLDSKIAALTEPLAVVLRALRRAAPRLTPGMRVTVVGAGQIGNLAAQVLAERGYAVTVIDKDERRLSFFEGIPSITTSVSSEHLGESRLIIEATGSLYALEMVLGKSSTDSALLLLGFPYGTMSYNFENLIGKDQVVVTSVGADSVDFDEALTLLPDLHMEPFTQMVMPLEEFKDAWELHRTGRHLKILLKP